MRIVANESSYDTRTVRRIITAVYRAVAKTEGPAPWWKTLRVYVKTNRTAWKKRPRYFSSEKILVLRLPKMRGTEWISLVRQQCGAPAEELERTSGRAVSSRKIALTILGWFLHWHPARGSASQWRRGWRGGLILPALLPTLVPLKIEKKLATTGAGGLVAERYARVLEHERRWMRKLKLAQTKLRGARGRRR